MIYGYEQPIQLPTLDLYDKLIMAMALNAAKDMYDRNELNLKDFYKTYGDFMSPIAADAAWWENNMDGAARRKVNEIYARGGDPLRNRADMAELLQFINSRPYAIARMMKESAKNAELYNQARRELEAKGLYSPEMEAYAGPGLDKYSTASSGVWNRMSPVPYQNMSDFSKAYFDGIKPIERHAVKDGINYTISEITPERLHQIADDHFNDLVSTPQGQLMYKMYKDKLGSDEAAREAFNNAVVSGNLKRVMSDDNFDEQRYKNESLGLQKERLRLSQELVRLQRARVEAVLRKQETNDANRWTTRLRNDIAAKASLNLSDMLAVEKLKKESTFNGARAAIIARHAENGVKYNPTVAEVHDHMKQARAELQKSDYYKNQYNAQSITPSGNDQVTARALFDNFSPAEPTGDIAGGKSGRVTFSKDGGLSLTKLRQLAYNNRYLSHGSATSKLHRYLKEYNISGFRHSGDVSVNHRTLADGVSQWDINGMVRIRRSDLKGFGTDEQLESAVKEAGGSIITMGSASVVKDKSGKPQKGYNANEWVVLPVTRTVDPSIHGDTEIDTWHEKQYGKKYAYNAESQFINEDLDNSLIDYDE